MRWFEKQRINWLLERKEPFNRQDLMDAFGISVPQASKDINKFLQLYPDTWKYNRSTKQYEAKNDD